MHGQMKRFTQLSESCSFVFLFYIVQGCHRDHILVLIWHTHFHILYGIHQIQENQPHSCLIDPVILTLTCHQRIDHILQQILDLQNLCHSEIKILSLLLILAENIYQKICQHIISPCHGISHIKKFRKDHKINSNVTLSRRQKLMFCILIKKQQLTLSNHYFLAVYNIGDRALAYIKHLNKIVSVSREINKPGMGTHSDQLTLIQHLSAVYNEIPA